ncbi:MAG: DUF4199 domain-containing protein [Cyclobacteriaceae bacterium]
MKLDNPLIIVPLKFGFFGAVMVVILFFLLYFTGANPLLDMKMFDFFILPIFLFFATKEFRDTHNSRQAEFWHGMTVGFVTYLTYALTATVVLVLFLFLADQQIFDDYVINTVAEATKNKEQTIEKLGEAAYNETLIKLKETSKTDVILDFLIKKLIIGLMLTIMIAVIMRRKPSEKETSAS